jgi:hypothetical protein
MKHSYTLLLCLTVFSVTQATQAPDQIINSKINTTQQSIDTIIAQANLDPIIAQALTYEVNKLTEQITANIQQDIQEIRVAAALSTILETIQKAVKSNSSIDNLLALLTDLKYAARMNTVHKLIMGAIPGEFKNTAYYTDPYTETIGFTLNHYVLNTIFTTLVALLAPTSFGQSLLLDPSSRKTILSTRILAGLTAHCAWLLEKKFIIIPMQQNQDNNQAI